MIKFVTTVSFGAKNYLQRLCGQISAHSERTRHTKLSNHKEVIVKTVGFNQGNFEHKNKSELI